MPTAMKKQWSCVSQHAPRPVAVADLLAKVLYYALIALELRLQFTIGSGWRVLVAEVFECKCIAYVGLRGLGGSPQSLNCWQL